MAITGPAASAEGRRGVGRRAGLTLQRILDAARSLDPERLTVQAVADKLGVDRKAVRHHVTDRDTLLGLMALDAVSVNASEVDIPADCTWQEACRIYARAFADAVIATDALADHLRLNDQIPVVFGVPTEILSTKLTSAGFSDEATLRILALLTNVCTAYARDVVFVARSGQRPRRLMAERVLSGRERQFENFARIVASSVDTYDREQLATSVEVIIEGVAAVFLRGSGESPGEG